VWVKVPKTGYVGVGRVTEAVCHVKDFEVETPEGKKPVVEVLKYADRYKEKADDPEKAAYFVRVQWLDTVPEAEAVNEVGLFGNQNTVCQPTTQSYGRARKPRTPTEAMDGIWGVASEKA